MDDMNDRGDFVIGRPDHLGVSRQTRDYLVRPAEEYLDGRPAPESPGPVRRPPAVPASGQNTPADAGTPPG